MGPTWRVSTFFQLLFVVTASAVYTTLRPPRDKPVNLVLSLFETVVTLIQDKTANGLKSKENVTVRQRALVGWAVLGQVRGLV